MLPADSPTEPSWPFCFHQPGSAGVGGGILLLPPHFPSSLIVIAWASPGGGHVVVRIRLFRCGPRRSGRGHHHLSNGHNPHLDLHRIRLVEHEEDQEARLVLCALAGVSVFLCLVSVFIVILYMYTRVTLLLVACIITNPWTSRCCDWLLTTLLLR